MTELKMIFGALVWGVVGGLAWYVVVRCAAFVDRRLRGLRARKWDRYRGTW